MEENSEEMVDMEKKEDRMHIASFVKGERNNVCLVSLTWPGKPLHS